MRRRFEVGAPQAPAPVSRRARRIEHPAPGQVRLRPHVRRSRARSAVRARSAHSGVRLTRRGRVLLFVLAAVAVYAAFGLGRASAGGPAAATRPSTVVVQSGDSLWSIALRAYPNADPRDVVGELKSLNHLSTADLTVGQKLRLP
jgi:nucleoid-associated protein YgaU